MFAGKDARGEAEITPLSGFSRGHGPTREHFLERRWEVGAKVLGHRAEGGDVPLIIAGEGLEERLLPYPLPVLSVPTASRRLLCESNLQLGEVWRTIHPRAHVAEVHKGSG